jgi:uncharacterized membrane protein
MRARLAFALLALALPGCLFQTIDDVACPTGGTTLTYENFGKTFFTGYCNRCHSADLGERNGAPDNFVFATVADIRLHKARIFARSAGLNDSMPPGPDDPPREERDRLSEWLACGAP